MTINVYLKKHSASISTQPFFKLTLKNISELFPDSVSNEGKYEALDIKKDYSLLMQKNKRFHT